MLSRCGKPCAWIVRRSLPFVLATMLVMLLMLPASGADKAKDIETINDAATVLQAMLSSDQVPKDVLSKADCVVVLPNVKKAGFGIGGTGGRGPLSCRTGKGFSGKWSAPAMFTIGGASIGLQIGGSSSDFVLLVVTQKAVDSLLKGETKLGRDATATAGPVGATSVGAIGESDILTYAQAKGLFAGTSLGGAELTPDDDANKRLYGKEISAKDIVLGNAVQPPAGENFVSLLNTKAPTRSK